ncbi:MAG: ABC transporter substrate-binding protein [Alkalispirochaeta sp.]
MLQTTRARIIIPGILVVLLGGWGVFSLLETRESAHRATLTYWTHTDANRTALEARLIEQFQRDTPGIELNRVTHGSQEISELILTAFAAGRGPDIFNLQIENAHAYITSGQVVPIDPQTLGFDSIREIEERYVPGVLDPVTHNGKLYGLPLELTNWAIYLNRSVFREAGLDPDQDYPRTWREMMDVSETIAQHDGETLTRRGFDFRYSDYLIGIVPMVRQLGGRLVSEDGTRAIVGESAWIEFLHFFQEWGPAGRNLGSPAYDHARSLFNQDTGAVAMAHTGLYQQGRIKSENPAFYDSGEWMVIPVPVFEDAVNDVSSSYYGHYLMVSVDTPPELRRPAWEFIWFLLHHAEEYLREVNIVQPTRALMESDLYRSIPYSQVFSREMERAEVVYYDEHSSQLQDLVQEAVESVMFGESSPEKAYIRLRSFAQALLDES